MRTSDSAYDNPTVLKAAALFKTPTRQSSAVSSSSNSLTGQSGRAAGTLAAARLAEVVTVAHAQHRSAMERLADGYQQAEHEVGDPLLNPDESELEVLTQQADDRSHSRSMSPWSSSSTRSGATRCAACRGSTRSCCSVQSMRARYLVGQAVSHVSVRVLIMLLILLDLLLFLLEFNGMPIDDVTAVSGPIIVGVFVAEILCKLFAFRARYFMSWWNIFDFTVVSISVALLVVTEGLQSVITVRTLRLLAIVQRSLRILRIVLRVYTQAASRPEVVEDSSQLTFPIETAVSILKKVKFSSELTAEERHRVDAIISAILSNNLFKPDLDLVLSDLTPASQIPQWISCNFHEPMQPVLVRPASQRRMQRGKSQLRQLHERQSTAELSADSSDWMERVGTSVLNSIADLLDDGLCSWTFNIFSLESLSNGSPLFHMLQACLWWHGSYDALHLDVVKVAAFAACMESQYHHVYYHTSTHGADVVQAVHVLMAVGGLGEQLTDLERFTLLISAAAHDVAHPGLTNAFLVNTSAQEALLRNDTSVLEHMHCCRLFATLAREKYAITAHFTKEDQKRMRFLAIQCILATDMSRHFEFVGKLQSTTTQVLSTPSEVKDWTLLQMQMCIKMADIAHPTRPFEVHSEWTRRCMFEFFAQGDSEKDLGLPVSPLMNRDDTDVSQAQQGFIKVLVRPLYTAWFTTAKSLSWAVESVAPEDEIVTTKDPTPATLSAQTALTAYQLLSSILEGLNGSSAHWQAVSAGTEEWHLPKTLERHPSWTRSAGLGSAKALAIEEYDAKAFRPHLESLEARSSPRGVELRSPRFGRRGLPVLSDDAAHPAVPGVVQTPRV